MNRLRKQSLVLLEYFEEIDFLGKAKNLDKSTEKWLQQLTSGWDAARKLDRKDRAKISKANQGSRGSLLVETEDGQASYPSRMTFHNLEVFLASEVGKFLKFTYSWDEFDVFGLAEATMYPVTALVDYVVVTENITQFEDISINRLLRYMQHIDTTYCYRQSSSYSESTNLQCRNPYHNNVHGADVVQSIACILSGERYSDISRTDMFSCVVAAAIHDYHHPGRTNPFLVHTSHDISILHNDQSPCERFHLSMAFQAMQNEEMNFLYRIDRKTQLMVRQNIIDLVLATDLTHTSKYLNQFQMLIARENDMDGSISESSSKSDLSNDDSLLLLQIALKVADIAHPAKLRDRHIEWTNRIQEEFFLQGDKQKIMDMSVDPLCDRETVVLHRSQMGFIDFVCRPLIVPFAEFSSMQTLATNLNHNYEFWSTQGK